MAMTDALVQLLTDRSPSASAQSERITRTRRGRGAPAGIRGRAGIRGWTRWARDGGLVLRGLLSVAGAALPAPNGLAGAGTTERRYAMAELPAAARVRPVARERAVSSTALLLTVVADALHRFLACRDENPPEQRLRAMVPHSTRPGRSGADGGSWTSAMALNLPVGPWHRHAASPASPPR